MVTSPAALRSRERKAAHLVVDGKVAEVQARVFVVTGSTGVYVVSISAIGDTCSCPSTIVDCSHVIACRAVIQRGNR